MRALGNCHHTTSTQEAHVGAHQAGAGIYGVYALHASPGWLTVSWMFFCDASGRITVSHCRRMDPKGTPLVWMRIWPEEIRCRSSTAQL